MMCGKCGFGDLVPKREEFFGNGLYKVFYKCSNSLCCNHQTEVQISFTKKHDNFPNLEIYTEFELMELKSEEQQKA